MRFQVIFGVLAAATATMAQVNTNGTDPVDARDHFRHNCCVAPSSSGPWTPSDVLTAEACALFRDRGANLVGNICFEASRGPRITGDEFFNACQQVSKSPGPHFPAVGAGYRGTC